MEPVAPACNQIAMPFATLCLPLEHKVKLGAAQACPEPLHLYMIQLQAILKAGRTHMTRKWDAAYPRSGSPLWGGPYRHCVLSRNRPCHVTPQEEIRHPHHLPRLPRTARTGIIPHHGPVITGNPTPGCKVLFPSPAQPLVPQFILSGCQFCLEWRHRLCTGQLQGPSCLWGWCVC